MKTVLGCIVSLIVGLVVGSWVGYNASYATPKAPFLPVMATTVNISVEECTDQKVIKLVKAFEDTSKWHQVVANTEWYRSEFYNFSAYRNSHYREVELGAIDASNSDVKAPDISAVCRWKVDYAFTQMHNKLNQSNPDVLRSIL